MTDVPDGTVQDVLDWVGDDPGRAQAALDAEEAGQQRSTLITRLEALAVTDSPAGASTATDEPSETILTPGPATEVSQVFLRDADADDSVRGDLLEEPDRELPEAIPVAQVETFQTVRSQQGFGLRLNGGGAAFVFTPQLLATLKAEVDKAVAGVVL